MTGLAASAAVGSVFSGIGKWVSASAAHILLAVLAIVSLFAGWETHEAGKWRKVADSTEARRVAEAKVWASADRINHASINTCVGSLDHWSEAVREWSSEDQVARNAAQAALRGATARGQAMEALAHRLDDEAVLVPGTDPGCRTSATVMASKGSL